MREIAMRQSAQLVLLMSLTFFTGAAHAVDRGQFENVPDDIRAWFKGVRSQDGVPCCDISDGHRTEYDVRAGAYWGSNQWFVVAGAGKGDHSKRRKPAWRSRRLVCQSSRQYRNPLFRPGRCRVSGALLIAGQPFAFLLPEQSDSVLPPTVTRLNHSIPAPGTP